MQYFWHTVSTIPDGLGFTLFGPIHLLVLALSVLIIAGCSLHYRSMGSGGRDIWRKVIVALLLADELFKHAGLLANGNWTANYIPLHLCSINIFLIAYHCFRPSKSLGNFLYTVCIPGAVAAMLFPTWTELPPANFMFLHSTSVHILLILYPVALTVGGDIRPQLRQIPKCLLILAVMAALIVPVNLLLDTNFFFLDHADPGNPLYFFQHAFGSHLLGFPVIIAGVLLVMHTPWVIARKLSKTP